MTKAFFTAVQLITMRRWSISSSPQDQADNFNLFEKMKLPNANKAPSWQLQNIEYFLNLWTVKAEDLEKAEY